VLPSQLEKIDMLDYADFIAINKSEKVGAEDAYREVMINYIRNRGANAPHDVPLAELELPVYAVSSNHFNNSGVNRLFKDILKKVEEKDKFLSLNQEFIDLLPTKFVRESGIIKHKRINYLAEISEAIHSYHHKGEWQAELAGDAQAIKDAIRQIEDKQAIKVLETAFKNKWHTLSPEVIGFLSNLDEKRKYFDSEFTDYEIQGKNVRLSMSKKSLSGTKIPKIAFPTYYSWRDLIKFYFKENFPGEFPYYCGSISI